MASAHSDRTAAAKRRLREKFRRRRVNLFRKADQLSKIAEALVYVVVVRNDMCYSYNSAGKDSMPPSFNKRCQKIERKGPQDYHEKQSDVDDEDLGDFNFNSPYQENEDCATWNVVPSFTTAPYDSLQDEHLIMDVDPIDLNSVAIWQQPQIRETQEMDLDDVNLHGASTDYLYTSPLGVLQDGLDEPVDNPTSSTSVPIFSPAIAQGVDLAVDHTGVGQVDDGGGEHVTSLPTPSSPRHASKRRGYVKDWTLPSPPYTLIRHFDVFMFQSPMSQGSYGASLASRNNQFTTQDSHHPCRQSPVHGDITTLAVDQQLLYCRRKIEEMGQIAQNERAKMNEEQTGRVHVELKLRDTEKALAVQQQRADSLEESLKLLGTDYARNERQSNEQWTTVADLVGLLRRQVIDGEEVDVSNLYRQKDSLTYERNELKDALGEKQNLADQLRRELDRMRIESEVVRTRHEAEVSLARRNYEKLLGDLSNTQQQFELNEQRWKAFARKKEAEIGDLSARLAWHSQPKVGPVPKKRFAGHNSQQTA